jgi:rhodanese-related sulfurtransferase
VLMVAFSGCQAQIKSISVDDFQTLLQTDSTTVLVDVRNENEFVGRMDKIKQAIHIPLGELESRSSELEKYKDKPVYIICRSGNRSGRATKLLTEMGFDAINVSGGMLAYSKKYRANE